MEQAKTNESNQTLDYLEGDFRKEFKTKACYWNKKEFHTMLRAVRKQGFNVQKRDMGYTIHAANGALLLRAMNGRHNYLVRMVADLFA